MYAAGQNAVAGHQIKFYDTTGVADLTLTLGNASLPGSAPNGQSQRTILVGGANAAGNPDFEDTSGSFDAGEIDLLAGAVCFDNIDCVSWGSFSSPASLPSPAGNPLPLAGGFSSGSSITRSIARGCPTLLEAGDDTNNSAADFARTVPSPRNNSVTPTEVLCNGGSGGAPDTEITKAPKNKLRKPKAKYKFTSSEPSSTFECAIDKQIKKDRFKPCEPPYKKRVDDGKHKFQVAAIDADGNVDPSPAKDRFKVVD